MKLVWLAEARDDVQRLSNFLTERDLEAARRMLARVRKGAQTLMEHPRAGKRMEDDTNRCELFLPFGVGAYVLRYRLQEDRILILRVWHSRESRGE
jgi:plasmid stabilization system protein ParE